MILSLRFKHVKTLTKLTSSAALLYGAASSRLGLELEVLLKRRVCVFGPFIARALCLSLYFRLPDACLSHLLAFNSRARWSLPYRTLTEHGNRLQHLRALQKEEEFEAVSRSEKDQRNVCETV